MKPSASRLLRWAASLLVPLSFIQLLLFVRIPLDVYLASPVEHSSSVTDILAALSVLGLGSLLAVTAAVALLCHRIPGDARVLLIALALAYWVVVSFFGRAYPLLDGTVLRIEPDRLRLLLEFAVLIALVALVSGAQRRVELPALLFLGLLAAFNVWSVLAAVRTEAVAQPADHAAVRLESPFALSPEANVLVVVMDTFQSDYLEDVFARAPGLRDHFEGFVYFPDTLGVAPTTFLSLPAIHSGRLYDPERSMSGYFDSTIRESSFLGRLAASGYRSILVNPIRQLCPGGVICLGRDELLRGRWRTVLGEALYLLDISLMRSAPEFLKDWVFNAGQFRISPLFAASRLVGEARLVWDDDRLLAMASKQVSAASDRPTALFLHLMNTHPPYVLDANCTVVPASDRLHREGAIQQTTCAVRRITALLEALRDRGIYDQTLVIVLGDHGFASAAGAADLASTRPLSGSDPPGPDGRLIGSANPLLLIKPPQARGALRTDPRPASLRDVAATVCAAQVACAVNGGIDLLGPDTATGRSRRFMAYTWEHRFWELGYIPEVDFYQVNGPLGNWASWNRELGSLRRQRIERMDASSEGGVLSFGAGWAEPEPEEGRGSKRWVIGREAQLMAQLEPDPERHIAYQIDLEFYTPEFISNQAVRLQFNGQPISRRVLEHRRQVVSFRLPAELARAGPNRIDLLFDQSVVPGGEDQRSLATSFFSATLSEVERRAD